MTRLIGTAIGLVLSTAAASASSEPVSFGAAVEIVQPLSTRNLQDLGFGLLRGGGTDGSVVISPEGVVSRLGGAVIVSDVAARPSIIEISGEPDEVVHYELPQMVSVGGLKASDFTLKLSGEQISPGRGRLSSTGRQTAQIGASLFVPANTPERDYTANILINVRYE